MNVWKKRSNSTPFISMKQHRRRFLLRQEDDILRVSTALSESRAAAIVLLRHFNWNLSKLFDNWFDDEDQVRNLVGLYRTPIVLRFLSDHPITCGICLEICDNISNTTAWASCGHPFCRDCYGGYISKSINDEGPGCLFLRCPDPSCGAAVGEDMIGMLIIDNTIKLKYSRYLCGLMWKIVTGRGRSNGVLLQAAITQYEFCWHCLDRGQKAVDAIRLVQAEYLDRLSLLYGQEKPLLRFITEAWQQIIRCRRVLQWSYAYGYYFPQHQWAKKQFFEYLQGEAEFSLERLHYCAEKELEKYLDGENLVRALEDGLTEVESNGTYWSCELCSFMNSLATTSYCYKVVPPPSDIRDATAAAAVGTTQLKYPVLTNAGA
ncbi:hypothetical protein F8388_002836 [Cannabis sativa]|uniref:RBR-type E3 ubiquitin transferase n=1 Tax=Cannabis sativa TaxID=3483 RepID=A0A7J6EFU5_CANSA|nr:hypothetical protein F8388_002836 [Cannabis sativa]